MTQPTITAENGRSFPAYAIAIQAILINKDEEILLLNSPKHNLGWQIVSGGLDAEETVLDGTLREVAEEVGEAVQVHPLGTVHSHTFQYDKNVPHMIGIYYLMAYQNGIIIPGDDMAGSEFRWWSIKDLEHEQPTLHPSTALWMLKRAVELFRSWNDGVERPLQPKLEN